MIYFIQSGDGGPIKIGFAKTAQGVRRRLYELQIGNPAELRLLGFRSGEISDEAALHARFAGQRLRGEWFEPCDEIFAVVQRDAMLADMDLGLARWEEQGFVLADRSLTTAGVLYLLTLEDLAREAGINVEGGVGLVHDWAASADAAGPMVSRRAGL